MIRALYWLPPLSGDKTHREMMWVGLPIFRSLGNLTRPPLDTFVAVAGPPVASNFTLQGFIFNQLSPVDVWTIAHNLGFRPSVSVAGLSGIEIEVAVQHLSDLTLQIMFINPTAGTARLT